MADRTAAFVITFDGSAGSLDDVLAGIRRAVKTAVSDIQATASKVELFDNLGDNVGKAQAAFAAATKTAADLGAQIEFIRASGGKVGADLTTQFRQAEAAASTASKAYAAQVTQLTALQAKLTAAGVNTGALAAEQVRLATALKTATAAAAEQSAKSLLSFKSIGDVQPQILALQKAFDILRASGKLSATEIAAAQGLLVQKIAEVRAEVTGLGTAFETQTSSVSSVITGATAKLLGFAAVVGTVVGSVKNVAEEANRFNLAITQVGTVTNVSKAELADLAEGVRALARTMGFDAVEAAKTLYDILRAGISPDNALTVLQASADAAKASLTDIGTASKLSVTLLNGFDVQVGDLSRTLDVLFQGMRDGGPTLAELSAGLGALAPVAKATNTPIDELTAALQVLVKAGVDAPTAIADLNRVLTKLNTSEARTKLHALGIEVTGLSGTLQQLASRGLGLDQLGDLGLASSKSATAIAALTNNAKGLNDELARLRDSAGATAKAVAALEDTPQERFERFNAAIKDFEINLGNAVGSSSRFAVVLTSLLNAFNNLAPTVRNAVAQNSALQVALGAGGPAAQIFGNQLLSLNLAASLVAASQSKAAEGISTLTTAASRGAIELGNAIKAISAATDAQLAETAKTIDTATGTLTRLTGDLQKLVTDSQAATAASLTDLAARANAQIAALDRSTAAEKATAAATLAIQLQLAADRLAIIDKNTSDVLKAINDSSTAQIAIAKKTGQDIATIELGANQATLQVLAAKKAQYQQSANDLVAQEQAFVQRLNAIDQSRVSFNAEVQQKLTDIRNEGLSDFDAYIVKVGQINALLAQAQLAFQQGGAAGLALGKTYTDQAIALTGTLKTVVNENGTAVVTAFELQQTKLGLITKAADQYNEALDGQEAAANDGKRATVGALDAIAPRLKDVTQQYDDLNAKVKEGLAIKLTLDEEALAKAQTALNDALSAKDGLDALGKGVAAIQAQVDGLVANLKKGITDGADVQIRGIATALQDLATNAPKVQLKIDDALAQVASVKTAVDKIAELKAELKISSNVGDIQAAVDKLKLPTESTHTVHIKVDGTLPGSTSATPTVPGFAKGGAVGPRWMTAPMRQAVQRFAEGGSVWRVPGSGNSDTVPAHLIPGSFVMRKAAVNTYGQLMLENLARARSLPRFAAGGPFNFQIIGSDRPPPDKNYINTADEEALTGEIDAPTLPSDPKQKRRLIEDYSFAVAAAALTDDYFYWRQNLRLLNSAKDSDDFQPSDAHLEKLLDTARNIGLNLGISHNTHTGFDVDGRRWHKQLATNLPAGLFGALTYEYSFYNKGGNVGTDTVNALLTPGEAVISAPAARSIGYGVLEQMNRVQFSRADLESWMSPRPAPQPARFAGGGVVTTGGNGGWPGGSAPPNSSGPITVNISGSLEEFYSVDNVRRYLMPVIREIERRSK